MSEKKEPFAMGRRTFLRTVTFSGGAGLLAGSGASLGEVEAGLSGAAQQSAALETSTGYHLSEHIRQYYRKAAF